MRPIPLILAVPTIVLGTGFLGASLPTMGSVGGPLSGAAMAATVSYNAALGTLPQAQGWVAYESGAAVPVPVVSGGVMHQGPTDFSGTQNWGYTGASFNFSTGVVTVDFRLRITNSTFHPYPRGGYTIVLGDANGRLAGLYLSSTSVFLTNDPVTGSSPITAFDTTDGFHDYSWSIGPTGSFLSIDSNPIVSLGLGGLVFAANTIEFGDGTVLGSSESDLTYFNVSGVTVASIPEPFSAGLFAAGLVAITAIRRRS